jgi:hypothetical protein
MACPSASSPPSIRVRKIRPLRARMVAVTIVSTTLISRYRR